MSEDIKTEIKQAMEEVVARADAELDAKKDEWAMLAREDPDAARRQLRTVWGVFAGIALIAGFCLGIAFYKLIL